MRNGLMRLRASSDPARPGGWPLASPRRDCSPPPCRTLKRPAAPGRRRAPSARSAKAEVQVGCNAERDRLQRRHGHTVKGECTCGLPRCALPGYAIDIGEDARLLPPSSYLVRGTLLRWRRPVLEPPENQSHVGVGGRLRPEGMQSAPQMGQFGPYRSDVRARSFPCTKQEPVSQTAIRPDHIARFLLTGTLTGLIASALVGGKQTRSKIRDWPIAAGARRGGLRLWVPAGLPPHQGMLPDDRPTGSIRRTGQLLRPRNCAVGATRL